MTDNRTTEPCEKRGWSAKTASMMEGLVDDGKDSQATELLCKLLEERGVEFDTDIEECCYDEPPKTTWDFVLCGLEMTVTATEFVDVEGKKYLEMDFHHAFTPEQAIAATLGNSKSSADAIAELRKTVREAFSRESVSILVEGHAIMRAIDAVEAATLGSERDEIYDAGFDSGVKATLQQLEGVIACGDGLADIEAWIDEQWKEYES